MVLCPGDDREFEKVYCGDVVIPRHPDDDGRHIWWNGRRGAEPKGDIIAVLNGKKYRYPCHRPVTYGSCRKR